MFEMKYGLGWKINIIALFFEQDLSWSLNEFKLPNTINIQMHIIWYDNLQYILVNVSKR